MPAIQEHQDYHEGFFDALDGEPLFAGECTAEYEAGWRAWWAVKDLLNNENFLESAAAKNLPADATAHQFDN